MRPPISKAEVLAKLKKYDEALAALDKIVELEPKARPATRPRPWCWRN